MTKHNQEVIADIVVIGGGPAGMMASIASSHENLKVLLLEKNSRLGEKLLITGGGRCNLTNHELDNKILLKKYKEAESYLYSPFSKFSVAHTLDFFHKRGLETKVENENRVFPTTDKASSVWQVLKDEMKENHVLVLENSPVKNLVGKNGQIHEVILKDNTSVKGKKFILATGSLSHPETGSTGDGFKWLQNLGHKISEPDSSLVPVTIFDSWVKELQGKSLKDIKISVFKNDKKQKSALGKVLFTHFGVSGPTIINFSRLISDLIKYDEVFLELDLLPKIDYATLNLKLQNLTQTDSKKKIKNALTNIIDSFMIAHVLEVSKVNSATTMSNLKRDERIRIFQTIKHLKMKVSGVLGSDKAIISSGGVSLDEIDTKTMQSKLYPNLYIVGDLLNIDRPSGGFSLQLCWTTGFVAGQEARKTLQN